MVIAVLLRVLLASLPSLGVHIPLAPDKPSAILSVPSGLTCESRRPAVNTLAHAAGFSRAALSCAPVPLASFYGPVEPQMPAVKNLIGYSAVASGRRAAFLIRDGFKIPSGVRYVTGVAEIDAYIKPDALVLYTRSDHEIAAAFALESAGVDRNDIAGVENAIVVRVRPVDDAQIAVITRAVESSGTANVLQGEIAYLYDCDKVEESLTGLALEQAREHARVLARAAGGTIGDLLGIVDGGGEVLDGTCGGDPHATLSELIARGSSSSAGRLEYGAYVTVRRRITAAWRLNGSPRTEPQLTGDRRTNMGFIRRFDVVTAFESTPAAEDSHAVIGSAILAGAIQPDRADEIADEWTYAPLRARYGNAVRRIISFWRPMAAVSIASRDPREVKQQIGDVDKYVLGLEAKNGRRADRFLLVSRTDCGPQLDAALFYAARDAIARLHGRAPQYLKEQLSDAEGYVPCSFSPIWASRGVTQPPAELSGSTLASVLAGY